MNKLNSDFSKSELKLINFLKEFISTEDFQNTVKTLRVKIGISEHGLLKPEGMKFHAFNLFTDYFKSLSPRLKLEHIKTLNLATTKIADELPIYDHTIKDFFSIYILFNETPYHLFNDGLDITGLCKVEDVFDFIDEYQQVYPPEQAFKIMESHFASYPIAIKLHPDISQNALISFIKRHWKIIQIYLNQYKKTGSKLGNIKGRNEMIVRRDEFIYQHRDKAGKEIARLVKEKFGGELLPYSYIPKIISRAKKRQKV